LSLPDDLNNLKPQRLERLLEELAVISRRVANGEPLERPSVTLHLGSGRELHGSLLDVINDSGVTVALLMDARDRFGHDVTHVLVSRLEAVTVHNAAGLLNRSGNAPPPPGKLELHRAFGALGERLNTSGMKLKFEFPASPEEQDLEALRDLLEPLQMALETIASDEIGRAALAHLETVALKVATGASAHLEDTWLIVITAHAFADRPNAKGLQALIEKAF
jgi:hypothetical protein